MDFAIEAVELAKRYGNIEALKNLSFSIPKGEIVAFLGPNSAGKTTTLKILAGIMPASFGEANVAGYSVAYQAQEVKRHVGYMPEHNPLPDDVTVEDFLAYRARLKELSPKVVHARVAEVADLCELRGRIMRRPIGVLSRGVRQRVGIAEALLIDPSILLLDEPTIGLDPHQVMSLRELIRSMRGKHTILLSTHILSEAEAMADRLLIINKGQRVAFGTPRELRGLYGTSNKVKIVTSLGKEEMEKIVTEVGGSVDAVTPKESLTCYIVTIPNEEAMEPLLRAINNIPGVRLREFVCERPSLESIFIQATAQKEEL